jgi:3-oxoacyl-[acyl-carrier-protein] synthase-3
VPRQKPYENVVLEALAFEVPPHRVTSTSIEDELAATYRRLGIPAGCIETLTGIQARRFWDEGTSIADAAVVAARKVYESTGQASSWMKRTGVVISTSVCKDFVEPSVAALVRGELGLEGPDGPGSCEAFDLGNACLGFMNGIDTAAMWIEHGRVDTALVVAAESSRHVVKSTVDRLNEPSSTMQDFKEALATLTLGSGAVAVLLVNKALATKAHRVVGAVSLGDPASSTICLGTSEWMRTDAAKLLTNGVSLAQRTWARAEDKLSWTRDGIQHFVCHQVGATHMATLFKKLELDLDKAPITYTELGNIGPAAVPLTLGLAVEDGRIRSGDRLALMGIGSGLSCMMMEVVW